MKSAANLLGVLLCFFWIGLAQAAPSESDRHWAAPIRAGGDAPPESLTPQSCGTCHADKLAAWSSSRHAHAFSPGLLGQLLDFASCTEVTACLKCHAPLAEQQMPWSSSSCVNPARPWQQKKQTWLVEAGVICAGCHQREGVVIGPVAQKETKNNNPHARSRQVEGLSQSAFCGFCHQFSEDLAVNGKPIQNTLAEWQASPFPARGMTCQKCHMPEGRHSFLGIHDPETVANGLTVQVESDAAGALYKVGSTAIGHAFPTYMIPRVTLQGMLFDAKGREIKEQRRQFILERRMEYVGDLLQEQVDTRLLPGKEVQIRVAWHSDGREGVRIQFRLIVEPDYHYQTHVFNRLLENPQSDLARDFIRRAMQQAGESRYTLFEKTVMRDNSLVN
ncbi:MAG: cytochrome c family protein [Magnetococcus sp. YQC-5]